MYVIFAFSFFALLWRITNDTDQDLIVVKHHTMSGFHNTDLDRILRALHYDTLLFGGAVTNLCVESTVRGGFVILRRMKLRKYILFWNRFAK